MNGRVTLKEAEKFHGHLGPYLILGLLAGELALKKLKVKKHFGLNVEVGGAGQKPKSCLLDGLQLSTGATYGKGNIWKYNGRFIRMRFLNCQNKKSLSLGLKNELIKRLQSAVNHSLAKKLAGEIYRMRPEDIFKIKT